MSKIEGPTSFSRVLPEKRPLDLHRVDVGEADLGVQAVRGGHAERVQAGVGVGELHPPDVLVDVQQHRVVHDAAVGCGHEHVLALLDRTLREVAARDHVDQPVGVGSADLNRPFDPDVPHRHALVQDAVLDVGVVEVRGEVHVVVDVVRGATGPTGGLEERRPPVPGAEVEGRALLEHLDALVDHADTPLGLGGLGVTLRPRAAREIIGRHPTDPAPQGPSTPPRVGTPGFREEYLGATTHHEHLWRSQHGCRLTPAPS